MNKVRNATFYVTLPVSIDLSQYNDDYFDSDVLSLLESDISVVQGNSEEAEANRQFLRETVFGLADDIISSNGFDFVIHESTIPEMLD